MSTLQNEKSTLPSDCTNQCCLVRLQTFYRVAEEHEAEAARVLEAECKSLLQNLRHEARVQAVRDYYASTNIRRAKQKCRSKHLSKEKYMKVITYS